MWSTRGLLKTGLQNQPSWEVEQAVSPLDIVHVIAEGTFLGKNGLNHISALNCSRSYEVLLSFYCLLNKVVLSSATTTNRREAVDVWGHASIWNIRIVSWFPITVSSLDLLPSCLVLFLLMALFPDFGKFSTLFDKEIDVFVRVLLSS